ncbi:MAG TPA: uracil-DNA glycosylase [Rhodobacteraceae bacterium]|nr:uracil-DNA glycosylase [Paracoccaceae bacterium]
MDSGTEYYDAKAALEWQVELGADEAIGDEPLNRYELAAEAPKPAPAAKTAPAAAKPAEVDPVAVAKQAAAGAADLPALQAALAAFEHCELKRGARNLVFSDGNPQSRVMIIGEAPGRDEDREGRPFVGRAGQLLDKMLAAIDLDRAGPDPASSVYITNILPWRPPQNRDPLPQEIAMLRPFVERHIELVAPDVIVLMGNISCLAMLGRKGITRMRGNWDTVMDRPVLPMFHPAYLLRSPHAKREAWADLLALKARLAER